MGFMILPRDIIDLKSEKTTTKGHVCECVTACMISAEAHRRFICALSE
jgi:hypothetical protein